MKSLLLLTTAPLLIAAQTTAHYEESVSDGLIFESNEAEQQVDRARILAEVHGGIVNESSGNRPIARRLRRVKKADVEGKESLRDLNAPLLEPIPHRALEECDPSSQYFSLDLTTDNYGFENRWTLKSASDGTLIQKGPPADSNYADNTRYVGGFCVPAGEYVFSVYDKFKDGMCCGTGVGKYEVTLGGERMFGSPTGDEDWEVREHYFTVVGSEEDEDGVDEETNVDDWDWDADYVDEGDYDENFDDFDDLGGLAAGRATGTRGCQTLKVQFKVDKYGKETTVQVKKKGSNNAILKSVKNVGAYQTKTLSKCVPSGTYTVTFRDQDGLCCKNGQGWYKISVRGTELASGGYFVGSKSHTIKVGHDYQSSMTARDKQYLSGHNSRRRTYHQNAGKSYRPLRWSTTLKSAANTYARKLLNSCSSTGIKHDSTQDGENLAKNKGSGKWGQLYPVDNIMSRWVENEAKWSYPKNAHLTQAIWRATSYLGCGESVKKLGNGQTCRMQVCRYTRAGNCNVRNGNWRAEAFKDDTACGRPCPSEGCYA